MRVERGSRAIWRVQSTPPPHAGLPLVTAPSSTPSSVAALTECMQDKQQAKFFRDRQELLQHSLPLGSYLLKPVQRILKYTTCYSR